MISQSFAGDLFIQGGVDPLFSFRQLRDSDSTRFQTFEGHSFQFTSGYIKENISYLLNFQVLDLESEFDGRTSSLEEKKIGIGAGYRYLEYFSLGGIFSFATRDVVSTISKRTGTYDGFEVSAFLQADYELSKRSYLYLKFDVEIFSKLEQENRSQDDIDSNGRSLVIGIGRVF